MAVSKSNLSAFTPGPVGEMKTIARDLALAHDGAMFHVEYLAADIADAGTASIAVTAGSAIIAHMAFEVAAEGKVTAVLYEGTTTTLGTACVAYNLNRTLKALTPTTAIKHTPTITTAGTAIGALMTLGDPVRGPEWVAEAGAKYLLVATNNAGTTGDILVSATFYEVEV
jgi:hypothetical protein